MYNKDATDYKWSTVDIAPTLMYDPNHNDQQQTSEIPQLGPYNANLIDFKHLVT
jgi:hypothetical protein